MSLTQSPMRGVKNFSPSLINYHSLKHKKTWDKFCELRKQGLRLPAHGSSAGSRMAPHLSSVSGGLLKKSRVSKNMSISELYKDGLESACL